MPELHSNVLDFCAGVARYSCLDDQTETAVWDMLTSFSLRPHEYEQALELLRATKCISERVKKHTTELLSARIREIEEDNQQEK